jgi:alkylhydroperoxidase family enzyme
VDEALTDVDHAMIGSKLKALLKLAGKVQTSGLDVKQEDIDSARANGASDAEMHDTVLIAATFSMFNRYVDGLASFTPEDPAEYEAMGVRMAEKGYVLPRT